MLHNFRKQHPSVAAQLIEDDDWARRKPYDEFDYGYVLTVHKAQGAQWDDVMLFDESFAFPDSRKICQMTVLFHTASRNRRADNPHLHF